MVIEGMVSTHLKPLVRKLSSCQYGGPATSRFKFQLSSAQCRNVHGAPPPTVPSNDLFLSPTFVQNLATELAVDPVFGPILRGAATALGRLVDRRGAPIR